jgi:transposase
MKPAHSCVVCAHSDIEAITLALVGGRSLNEVASEFKISRATLQRHHNATRSKTKKTPPRATPPKPPEDLTPAELEDMEARCLAVIESETDHRTRLMAVKEWRGVRELKIRLQQTSESALSAQAFAHHPAVVSIMDTVMTALEPHPDAQTAVLAAFKSTIGTPVVRATCSACSQPSDPAQGAP